MDNALWVALSTALPLSADVSWHDTPTISASPGTYRLVITPLSDCSWYVSILATGAAPTGTAAPLATDTAVPSTSTTTPTATSQATATLTPQPTPTPRPLPSPSPIPVAPSPTASPTPTPSPPPPASAPRTPLPTHLHLSSVEQTLPWGHRLHLQAVLTTAAGGPVTHQTLVFTVGHRALQSVVTDAMGTARVATFNTQEPGPVVVRVAYHGDGHIYAPSVAAGRVLSVRATVVVTVQGPLSGRRGTMITLQVRLAGADDLTSPMAPGPPSGSPVTVLLGRQPVLLIARGFTSGTGIASVRFRLPGRAGRYPLAVTYGGDAHWTSAQSVNRTTETYTVTR